MRTSNARSLLIVKQFFDDASRLSKKGNDFAAMKAILLLDHAVEHMVNLVIAELDEESSDLYKDARDPTWYQLWQAATKAAKKAGKMPSGMPRYKELKKIHTIRNQAQHHGVTPNPGEVSALLIAAHEMIAKCFKEVFGLDFGTYSPTDLIERAYVRTTLEDCLEAQKQQKFDIAIAGCVKLFKDIKIAIQTVKETPFWSGNSIKNLTLEVENNLSDLGIDSDTELLKEALGNSFSAVQEMVTAEINDLASHVEISQLGLSLADAYRMAKLQQEFHINESGSGKWEIIHWPSLEDRDLPSESEFAISFVTSLALLAQEAYPEAMQTIRYKTPFNQQPFWKG